MELKPKVIWITGLSGAGKTTVAKQVQERLLQQTGIKGVLIDGDEMRAALGKTSTYTKEERLELAYTYGRLSKLLSDQGFTVIVATISMFEEVRQWNRSHIKNYIETYLKVSPEERARRDPKNLYASGKDMVSESLDYQEPSCPDLIFEGSQGFSAGEIATQIINYFCVS